MRNYLKIKKESVKLRINREKTTKIRQKMEISMIIEWEPSSYVKTEPNPWNSVKLENYCKHYYRKGCRIRDNTKKAKIAKLFLNRGKTVQWPKNWAKLTKESKTGAKIAKFLQKLVEQSQDNVKVEQRTVKQ